MPCPLLWQYTRSNLNASARVMRMKARKAHMDGCPKAVIVWNEWAITVYTTSSDLVITGKCDRCGKSISVQEVL